MTNISNSTVQIHSFRLLRNAIGWIGFILPFILLLGDTILFRYHGPRASISNYYCSPMRDVFVGALCAVAFFLFFYKGYVNDEYGKWDNRATNIAGIAAIGIAWFPVSCDGTHTVPEIIHLACGSVFFITLALVSFFLFTRTRKEIKPTKRKRKSNTVYRICGVMIILCIGVMGTFFVFFNSSYPDACIIYISETIALMAFGISWLTKGKFFRFVRFLK